jgi:cephalosporin-C deacetylase
LGGIKMAYIDKYTDELFSYHPPLTKREDFDKFWKQTLEETKARDIKSERVICDYPSSHVNVYSISYNGFDDTRIHGWFIVPEFASEGKLPCLIHYHGFTGNAGRPGDFMHWITMGVCVLSVDCRAQSGRTGDAAAYSSGSTQSVVCKGILDKNEYYYRLVYMDCVKAIDFACLQEEVDPQRIIIEGGSQGGALGMAVCALDDRPWLAMVDVPSNSNIEIRVEGRHGSYAAVTDYLKIYPRQVEKVFDTLSYFDTMNMAENIKCKVLASVALKDDVCPAKMYFATYNRINAPKDIRIYPFNGHEGGGSLHEEVKLGFIRENLMK